MKKTILYLFLFTYSTVMLRPVAPYISDMAAHLLFYKDHILTVHSHHGKLHAHAAVAEDAKNDQSGKTTNILKKDNLVNEHIILALYKFPSLQNSTGFPSSFSVSARHAFIGRDFPPPRV